MNPYNFSILLFASWTFLLGAMILAKYKDSISRHYVVFSVWVTGWGIPYSIMISDNVSDSTALFAARIANASATFIGPAWYHFSLKYAGNQKQRLASIFYTLATLIVLFTFTPWFIPKVQYAPPFKHYPYPGYLYYVYSILFALSLIMGFREIFKKIRLAEGPEKIKSRNIAIAILIGFVGGSLSFFPVFGILVPQYCIFAMPVYPFLIAYFLSRKKLFDIDEIAQAAQRNKLETLGILAASINHELRNPIYVIRTLAEAYSLRIKGNKNRLSNEEIIAQSLETSDKTIHQSNRAMDIIERLAGFMRQEPASVQPVDLRKILQDVYLFLSYEIHISNIDLTWDLPEDFPPIQASPRYTEQIFFNLIVNACQAIKKVKIERGVIKVSGKKIPNGVEITIEDNGPGIPSDVLPKIFEPFYTTKDTGSGLGLYITKQLVEKCGGRISVESIPGKTAFHLIFKTLENQTLPNSK